MAGFPLHINPNTNTQIQCSCTSNCCCIPWFKKKKTTHEKTCDAAKVALASQNPGANSTVNQVIYQKEKNKTEKKSIF